MQRALCLTAAVWISFVSVAQAGDATGLQLRLIRTVKSTTGGIALCLDPATGQSFSMKIGEKFAGWELRAIHDAEAIFEGTSARAVIRISNPADGVVFTPSPSARTEPTISPTQPTRGPLTPSNGAWMDGDGQLISPPRK
jgi:hypothetical protein